VSTRVSEGKSLQNIKYPSQFTNFLAILPSTSPQDIICFKKILQEDLSLNDPRICHENMCKFKQFLDGIKYSGPIAASTDNTKLSMKQS
ncbi:11079_t:CDS:2, partial [Entrophospora sp. SA101]